MNQWMNRRKPIALEKYPKRPDDPELSAQMELLQTEEGFKWAFRDVGLRVEVDGETFVPDSIGPTEGYVVLRKEGAKGYIDASDEREVKIYADMDSDLLALGPESYPRCEL